MDIFYSSITIKDLFDQLTQTFHPLAKGKGLELHTLLPTRSTVIQADSGKLKRILGNLITNAIKFTEKGSVTLKAAIKGTQITFSVKDTGIGLLENEKNTIFEKFRQVDDSSTRKYEGIGLGLSIVKQLVELHHGTIFVTSIYRKGSTFSISIPLKKPTLYKKATQELKLKKQVA